MSATKVKIAVVTATRAEYGLLKPVIKRIMNDDDLDLDLIVTGTHLSLKHGNTQEEIIKDGFPIKHRIEILDPDNDARGISKTVAATIERFADCFFDDRPNMVVILGDRTELMGIAMAAANERIPIAHISGGEITEGAVDDYIRHALSKLSFLHFPSTEIYRKRIIQLGEDPARVFNVGALSVENILGEILLDEEEIRELIGFDSAYAIMTFHPVTLEDDEEKLHDLQELCKAMESVECGFVITSTNADSYGDKYNECFSDLSTRNPDKYKTFSSLGMKRYLSVLKHSSFMLGNSSSGITEAPILGIPTVNVGDRQKGRLMAATIINCKSEHNEIIAAMKEAIAMPHKRTTMFGDGNASKKIVEIIKQFSPDVIDLKKKFYDVDFMV